MAVNLSLTLEAEQDVNDAYTWYESQRIGLGEDFLNCIDAALQTIGRNPMLYPILFENYRRGFVRRFPYSIFYEYDNNIVQVYSIFHNSLNPQKLLDRLAH